MQESIIEVKNIGKKYRITHQRGGYVTLRDVLMNVIRSPFSFLKYKAKQITGLDAKEDFWALKGLNFSVARGEVIGIIGPNGAGKSTLLKILSQITPPTEGEIRIQGRIGSLLEVGTGFHPELTGRENIFLNGAILGMTKKEIAGKFDKIVEFAGIEKFLDTPVKHYSSGMYVRLAFSVAAHMETDILIIDEVLAVGDAEFQKKCIGKMDEITQKEGRTIIFVSHNMEVIRNLCTRCIILKEGKKIFEGDTEKALFEYGNLQNTTQLKTNKGERNLSRRGSGTLSFTKIEILDKNNSERNSFYINDTVRFKLSYGIYKDLQGLSAHISLFSSKTRELLTANWYEVKNDLVKKDEVGSVTIEMELTAIRPGQYILYFQIGDKDSVHQGTPINYDIVDNMTKPLIVEGRNENEKELTGVFSLPSRIINS